MARTILSVFSLKSFCARLPRIPEKIPLCLALDRSHHASGLGIHVIEALVEVKHGGGVNPFALAQQNRRTTEFFLALFPKGSRVGSDHVIQRGKSPYYY